MHSGFVNERTEDVQWQNIDCAKNMVLSKVLGFDFEDIFHCEIIRLELKNKSIIISRTITKT